jgi:hypothetical protein
MAATRKKLKRRYKRKIKLPRKKVSNFVLDEWRELGKSMKKQGLLHMDFRQRFTPQHMGVVKREFKKYRMYIAHLNNPRKFVQRRVKNPQPFKDLGYAVHKHHVMIPLDGYQPEQVFVRDGVINRYGTYSKRHSEIMDPGSIIDVLKNNIDKELPPHTYLTVRIAGSTAFSTLKLSYSELLEYIEDWEPKEDKDMREQLIYEMELVEIYGEENLK